MDNNLPPSLEEFPLIPPLGISISLLSSPLLSAPLSTLFLEEFPRE